MRPEATPRGIMADPPHLSPSLPLSRSSPSPNLYPLRSLALSSGRETQEGVLHAGHKRTVVASGTQPRRSKPLNRIMVRDNKKQKLKQTSKKRKCKKLTLSLRLGAFLQNKKKTERLYRGCGFLNTPQRVIPHTNRFLDREMPPLSIEKLGRSVIARLEIQKSQANVRLKNKNNPIRLKNNPK